MATHRQVILCYLRITTYRNYDVAYQTPIGRASLTGSSWREPRESAITGDNRLIDHSVTRRGQNVSSAFSYSI